MTTTPGPAGSAINPEVPVLTSKSMTNLSNGKAVLISMSLAVAAVLPWLFSAPNNANANLEDLCFDTRATVEELSGAQIDRYSRRSFLFAASQGKQAEEGLFWNSLTKTWLTDEQIQLLTMTYDIGLQNGGEEHARILQGVLLQETIAGQLGRIGHMTAPVGKRSYGVMQVKVTAARDVLKQYPEEFGRYRSDEALIVDLMTNDEFNIRIASKFLLMLEERSDSIEHALVAYNVGYRAANSVPDYNKFKYVVKVKRHLAVVVDPFNKAFIGESLKLAMN